MTADTETADRGIRSWLIIYAKGLAMGSADAVPGVSGGTIALIVGIYERLISALTALDPTILRHVLSLHRPTGRAAFLNEVRRMDLPFLVALGSGMVTAVVLLARVVEFALATLTGPTYAFFFGLIGASAVILGERAWIQQPRQILAAVAGFAIAFLIAGVSGGGDVPSSAPAIFLAGSIAISGMLLPGISGAFILLLLGQYETMTATLNAFVDGLLALGREGVTDALVQDGVLIAAFLSGAAVGVLTVAYAVRWALETYRRATLVFLVSLMVGSLRLPVLEVLAVTEATLSGIATVAVAAAVGAALIFALDWATEDLYY
ncbi:MAG: putative membrane protein [Natronomonas sp.]|jgi:putative membrane protein